MPSAGEGARISSAAQSDVGRTRTDNQDAFGEFTTSAGERLFIVADGMGGHRGGATASRLCVETVGREFAESELSGAERLTRGFELANQRIHTAATSDPELTGMGTTAVALVLSPGGKALLAWVGDSRAYRFRDGALELLSADHSVVGEMVRSGVLAAKDADSHPRRNELLRAIGPRAEVEPETSNFEYQLGDRFLLCSDGLWGPVPEAELGAILGYEAPDLAVRKLVAKANERGGPDNVTVQIAWVAEPSAAVLPIAESVPVSSAPARRFGLRALAVSASAIALILIGLTLYGLRQGEPAAEPASELSAAAPAGESESVGVAAAPAPPSAVAERSPEPAPQSAPAAAARAPRIPPAPAKAKSAPPAPVQKKAAAPKQPKAAAVSASRATAPAPPVEPAVMPAPAEAAPPESEPASGSAPVAGPPAAAPPARADVERFLSDWESAISRKDFGLYASLGLPGDEQSFRSRYVDNQAKLAFSLRDVEQTAPDELQVRVQMVLETEDSSGAQRIDEERRFRVRQTPAGLRYLGSSEE